MLKYLKCFFYATQLHHKGCYSTSEMLLTFKLENEVADYPLLQFVQTLTFYKSVDAVA